MTRKAVTRGVRGRLASLLNVRNRPGDPYRPYRKRLRKILDRDDVEILETLFDELESMHKGVDGEGFRITFKNRREKIQKLTGRFIKEDYEPKRIYRPRLIVLPLINNERAAVLLALIDRVLRDLATIYEEERSRPVTIGQINERLEAPLDDVREAFAYIIDSPASGGHGGTSPANADWYFMLGEQALNYPNLDAVLEQLTRWVESDAKAKGKGIPAYYEAQIGPQNWRSAATSWIGRHKLLSLIVVPVGILTGVLGFLVDLASIVLRAVELLKELDWL